MWRLQVKLHGVIPVEDGCFRPLQQSSAYWNVRLRQAAAVCNSLTWVSRATLAGDDLERRLFDMVEARFLVSSHHHGTDASDTRPVDVMDPLEETLLYLTLGFKAEMHCGWQAPDAVGITLHIPNAT